MYPSNRNEPPNSPTPSAPSSEFSQYTPPPPQQAAAPPPSLTPQQYGQYAQPPPVHVAPLQFVQYAAPPQYAQYAPPQSHSHGHHATGLPVQSTGLLPWSTGLCDCFTDVPNCCLTCLCPCYTFGQIAEIVDKGSTTCGVHGSLYALINLVSGCGCIYACVYRSKMRRQLALRESPCNDCLVHCCCEPCALCQEYRELQYRGFDISIGWEGNEERRRGVAMPPVVHGAMTR